MIISKGVLWRSGKDPLSQSVWVDCVSVGQQTNKINRLGASDSLVRSFAGSLLDALEIFPIYGDPWRSIFIF